MVIVTVSLMRQIFFFFFSSRRRHTRSLRDWSSDVCSSDLAGNTDLYRDESQAPDRGQPLARGVPQSKRQVRAYRGRGGDRAGRGLVQQPVLGAVLPADRPRSEERRVGKEWRSRW